MRCNVFTWNEALGKGYSPWLYGYTTGEVPTGKLDAVLDYKIWAKKLMAINCYFTQVSNGRKFQITVYYNHSSKGYYIDGIDFSNCLNAVIYFLIISRDNIGWPFLKAACFFANSRKSR